MLNHRLAIATMDEDAVPRESRRHAAGSRGVAGFKSWFSGSGSALALDASLFFHQSPHLPALRNRGPGRDGGEIVSPPDNARDPGVDANSILIMQGCLSSTCSGAAFQNNPRWVCACTALEGDEGVWWAGTAWMRSSVWRISQKDDAELLVGLLAPPHRRGCWKRKRRRWSAPVLYQYRARGGSIAFPRWTLASPWLNLPRAENRCRTFAAELRNLGCVRGNGTAANGMSQSQRRRCRLRRACSRLSPPWTARSSTKSFSPRPCHLRTVNRSPDPLATLSDVYSAVARQLRYRRLHWGRSCTDLVDVWTITTICSCGGGWRLQAPALALVLAPSRVALHSGE